MAAFVVVTKLRGAVVVTTGEDFNSIFVVDAVVVDAVVVVAGAVTSFLTMRDLSCVSSDFLASTGLSATTGFPESGYFPANTNGLLGGGGGFFTTDNPDALLLAGTEDNFVLGLEYEKEVLCEKEGFVKIGFLVSSVVDISRLVSSASSSLFGLDSADP